jgi:hypothetical protein
MTKATFAPLFSSSRPGSKVVDDDRRRVQQDDVEGVQHGNGVIELVADRVGVAAERV